VCDPLPVPKLVAPAVKVNALPVLSAYTKVPAGSATASPPDDPDGSGAAVFQLPPAARAKPRTQPGPPATSGHPC
jgi:hypothetical protein